MVFNSKFINGTVVTSNSVQPNTAIAVTEGTIAAVGASDKIGEANYVIDLEGQYLLPGVIDCHIHTRSPGYEYKEDWATATAAAAAGGVTTVIAMPNTDPIVDSPKTLKQVYDIASEDAHVDFQSYVVLTSENYDQVMELADAGASGFKVFLGTTFGNIESPTDGELYEAMWDAAKVNKRIGFHEENDEILSHLKNKFKEEGRNRPIDHAHSRPVVAEAEAVSRIILLAEHTDCPVHMFHLSSGTGAKLVEEGKQDGVNVTSETCPHYLWFTEEVLKEKGNIARIQPPIRDAEEREALWGTGIHGGGVDCIATDHAPHTDKEKNADEPFADTWESNSGFVGLESEVGVMATFTSEERLSLEQWVYMHSTRPAQIWGLYPQKGSLQVGTDADFTIIEPNQKWVLNKNNLYSKSNSTPFGGEKFIGKPTMTVIRGMVTYQDGELQAEKGFGKLVPSGETTEIIHPRRDF